MNFIFLTIPKANIIIFYCTEAAALRSIVLRYACAPTAKRSYLTTVCVLFCCFFGDDAFFEYFCTITVVALYGEYVVRSFLPDGVLLPRDHGLDFLHQLLWVFNQSIKSRYKKPTTASCFSRDTKSQPTTLFFITIQKAKQRFNFAFSRSNAFSYIRTHVVVYFIKRPELRAAIHLVIGKVAQQNWRATCTHL